MIVVETFYSVEVESMRRATAFYVAAFDAVVVFASPRWSSLRIAGVRIGLAWNPDHAGERIGLHFAVEDLAAACADVERAGGSIVTRSVEVAPGVFTAEVVDTEGNTFALSRG